MGTSIEQTSFWCRGNRPCAPCRADGRIVNRCRHMIHERFETERCISEISGLRLMQRAKICEQAAGGDFATGGASVLRLAYGPRHRLRNSSGRVAVRDCRYNDDAAEIVNVTRDRKGFIWCDFGKRYLLIDTDSQSALKLILAK